MLKPKWVIILASSVLMVTSPIIPNIAHADTNPNQTRNWEASDNAPLLWPSRTITYHIDDNCTGKFYKAWLIAINAWNRLGVIKLVESDTNPQIQLQGQYSTINGRKAYKLTNGKSFSTGNTNWNANYDSLKNITYLTSAQCQILSVAAYNSNQGDITAIAEHELGHALGFGHDNSLATNHRIHIMNAYPNHTASPLGTYEQSTLEQHYSSENY